MMLTTGKDKAKYGTWWADLTAQGWSKVDENSLLIEFCWWNQKQISKFPNLNKIAQQSHYFHIHPFLNSPYTIHSLHKHSSSHINSIPAWTLQHKHFVWVWYKSYRFTQNSMITRKYATWEPSMLASLHGPASNMSREFCLKTNNNYKDFNCVHVHEQYFSQA